MLAVRLVVVAEPGTTDVTVSHHQHGIFEVHVLEHQLGGISLLFGAGEAPVHVRNEEVVEWRGSFDFAVRTDDLLGHFNDGGNVAAHLFVHSQVFQQRGNDLLVVLVDAHLKHGRAGDQPAALVVCMLLLIFNADEGVVR